MRIHVPVLLLSLLASVTFLSTRSRPMLDLTLPAPEPVAIPEGTDTPWPREVDPPPAPFRARLIGVWPPTVFLRWNRLEVQLQVGECLEGWRLVACDREGATFRHIGSGALSTVEFPRGSSGD